MKTRRNEYFIDTITCPNEIIISKTDTSGIIIYANEAFAKISGYKVEELIGKPHNIVRHPDMPSSFFKNLWTTLKKKGSWTGCIKNLRKDGSEYWVFTEIKSIEKSSKENIYESKVIAYESKRTLLKF